jgi:hypothetical protein
MRGEAISLKEALARTRYKELRPSFAPVDLVSVIQDYPGVTEEWMSYSEDKRTSGGWYLLRDGMIGKVGDPESERSFASLSEAVAEYVVRELDFWVSVEEVG